MAGVPVGDTILLAKLREASKNSLTWHPRSQAEASSFDAAMTIWPALPAVVTLIEEAQKSDASIERMLSEGHDFWERHQHSPDSDEMSAALTDLYFAQKRARAALAPFVGEATQRGSSETPAPVTTRDIVGLVPDIAGDLSAVEHVRQLRATESDNE
jgi:hypothetical protein